MKRRAFIALGGAAALSPLMAIAATKPLTYKTGLVEQHLAAGKTVFVDFYTSWCSTCRAQGRAVEALRDENPAYDENIVFVKVDWDIHSGSAIAKKYKIPRRSTLMVLRGEDELGRIVAGTSRNAIKALMDTGLPTS